MNVLQAAFLGIWMALASLFGLAPPPASDFPTPQPPPLVQEQLQEKNTSVTNSNPVAAAAQQKSSKQTSKSDLPATGSAWLSSLPLGDGKYTTSSPKKGYVYVCHVATGGGGAQGSPTWIHGSSWDPAEKISVQGSVNWPSALYSMKISGSSRVITSNGLPTDHTSGIFPIQASDPAHAIDANPNSIKAESYSFTLPVSPTMLATPDCVFGQVGIMNDGVPLFDGFDAEYRDAVAHEVQDAYEAHPEITGAYHYHGFESGPIKEAVSTVVGFAFDGYPITGAKLPDGTYLTSADLDECHGITSAVSLDGAQVNIYHYVLTQDFPYSVACFRGASHEPKPGGAGGRQDGIQQQGFAPDGAPMQQAGQPPAPPQAAIDACTGKSSGATCMVVGGPSGTCTAIGSYFACKPQ